MRSGLIGLGLFVLALFFSLFEGLMAWRLHPDRMVAVLALALVAVVVAFVSKGMVESIFEKYRLATMLGISLGLLRSAVTSASAQRLSVTGPAHAYGEL
jgi:MFS-type transporter involved in bile tolerance (Atg22 family)